MPDIIPLPPGYAVWLAELKTRIHTAQQRATLAVNLVLLTKLKTPDQRLAYAQSAIERGWSRSVLTIHRQVAQHLFCYNGNAGITKVWAR
jgi:hypothetical protein